jgi:hypothetical protein
LLSRSDVRGEQVVGVLLRFVKRFDLRGPVIEVDAPAGPGAERLHIQGFRHPDIIADSGHHPP